MLGVAALDKAGPEHAPDRHIEGAGARLAWCTRVAAGHAFRGERLPLRGEQEAAGREREFLAVESVPADEGEQ